MVALGRDKTFPVLISNHTNKTFRVKRGSVIANMEKLEEENVVTSVEETKEEMGKTRAEGDRSNGLSVPEPFRGNARTLVEEKRLVCANGCGVRAHRRSKDEVRYGQTPFS